MIKNVLFVSGTFENDNSRSSGLAVKIYNELKKHDLNVEFFNGGSFSIIENEFKTTNPFLVSDYDAVIWWADVPNDYPKFRSLKDFNKKIMLVTSKNNRKNKYAFQEMVQRTFVTKSNLCVEFYYTGDPFNIGMRLFDPLGCVWYDGTDVTQFTVKLVERLNLLSEMVRCSTTTPEEESAGLLAYYFNQFKEEMVRKEGDIEIPDKGEFIKLVKEYSHQFTRLMFKLNKKMAFSEWLTEDFSGTLELIDAETQDYIQIYSTIKLGDTYSELHKKYGNNTVERVIEDSFAGQKITTVYLSRKPRTEEGDRFLGNASLRCIKGLPSFRGEDEDIIFVSRRNVNKNNITAEDFVPVMQKSEAGDLFYYGDHKPSVDAPIQAALYKKLPNINYMIHSHCYIKDAPFTLKNIPCGAMQEVNEVLDTLDFNYKDLTLNSYKVNLIGHGSIVMGNSIEDLKGVEYISRPQPESLWRQ